MRSALRVVFAIFAFSWLHFTIAAPSVSLIGNTLLDNEAIYFVSYDGLVNVNSFQLSGVLTYGDYQYAAWYASDRTATLARRALPSGDWSAIELAHTLSTDDSHNVIALGVSPQDGVLHVAMDCHSTTMYYTKSAAGLATGDEWSASQFGSVVTTLGGLNIGTVVTYPQFIITPTNLLQFVYRTGVSGNGDTQLAEYNSGTWSNVGSWASATGTYTANGATSTARNLYIHGVTYDVNDRLHISGTWRENNGGVSCSSGGLTNHDTVYIYSDDLGRTWKNNGSSTVGTSGSSPITVSTTGLVVDSLPPNYGLMNQESQTTDSNGQIHIIISYVPGRFTSCVTNYAQDRVANGYAFHLYRSAATGLFTKVEIPFPIVAVGRSQIAMDASDNVYVVLPGVRVVSASASSSWTDWTLVYDGDTQGLNAFGEVTLDRAALADGRLSILYQEASSGTTPSRLHVIEFTLDA